MGRIYITILINISRVDITTQPVQKENKNNRFWVSVKVRVILIYAFQLGFSSEEDMYVVIVFFFYSYETGYKIQCNRNTSHVRLKENNGVTVKTAWLAGPMFENEV